MAKILFAYEFGAGLGHFNRLRVVAERLRDHEITFALPEPAIARDALERGFGQAARLLQGSVWAISSDPKLRQIPTHTFADVAHLIGFQDLARLEVSVRSWLTLVRHVRPDLIVADFAPALRLATAGKIPTVVVGNGYTVPPAGIVLPPIRPWQATVPPLSRRHEGELLASMNEMRIRTAGPAVDHFADLFQGEATFACTLAEFDPYGRDRKGALAWPFNVPTIPPTPDGLTRNRIFAYFQAGHPALSAVLAALDQLGRRAEIYVQGADPRVIAARCRSHVGVHTKPADFAAVLPRSTLLLHHAGLGTAYAGLVAAVPQVVLPNNLEHSITTAGLEAFGCVAKLPGATAPDPADIARTLAVVLDGGPQKAAAEHAAAQLAARRDADSIDRVAEAARGLL